MLLRNYPVSYGLLSIVDALRCNFTLHLSSFIIHCTSARACLLNLNMCFNDVEDYADGSEERMESCIWLAEKLVILLALVLQCADTRIEMDTLLNAYI